MAALLVSTEWLAQNLSDPKIRIVDTRWYLLDNEKTGRGEYERGHIPGAAFMNVDGDLAAPFGQGPGRHPLPSPERFAEGASRAGIGPDTYVIAYDDMGGANAGRLWWLLRYHGHNLVSVLDGGVTRWIAEGRPIETKTPSVPRATFVPGPPHREWVVDQSVVDQWRQDPRALVLDSRAPERYEGKTEPIDPKAGHIPGAKSAWFVGNVRTDEDWLFRKPQELRERFEQLGADKAERIACYCGSGVNACENILALSLAGFDRVYLYEGSWSDWSRTPNRPVAIGPEP